MSHHTLNSDDDIAICHKNIATFLANDVISQAYLLQHQISPDEDTGPECRNFNLLVDAVRSSFALV